MQELSGLSVHVPDAYLVGGDGSRAIRAVSDASSSRIACAVGVSGLGPAPSAATSADVLRLGILINSVVAAEIRAALSKLAASALRCAVRRCGAGPLLPREEAKIM